MTQLIPHSKVGIFFFLEEDVEVLYLRMFQSHEISTQSCIVLCYCPRHCVFGNHGHQYLRESYGGHVQHRRGLVDNQDGNGRPGYGRRR